MIDPNSAMFGADVPKLDPVQPGETQPKSWFADPFALLDSMGLGYRVSPSSISYETLKQMAYHNTLLAAIHNLRITQVANFCQLQQNRYSIGFKLRHKNPNHKYTQGEKEYARSLEEMILKCGWDKNGSRDDFVTFTKKVMRDRLRYDQVNFEVVKKRSGVPHSFYAVDASTFRIKQRMTRGGPVKAHRLPTEKRYVQIISGAIVNEYVDGEMAWGVSNPRTDIMTAGYGYSEEEQLITTVTSHLWAEEWNRRAFSQGSTTKGIVNLRGNIPPQQLEAFRRQWLSQVSGVTNAWRTPILNSEGVEWVSLQPTNNEMGYQAWLEYLIKIASAIYLVDPAELNFDTRAGVGNSPMFMTTNEAQQKMSKDRGLQPLLRYYAGLLNKYIIEPTDEKWRLEFIGLDAKTEEQAIELRLKELQSYKTLNEIRREDENLPPVADGDIVLNPTYIGYKNQQQQMQMAQAQQGAGGQPGQPGAQPQGGESLFNKNPNKQLPPFQKEEQQAAQHIEGAAQGGEKHPKNISDDQTLVPEWERTIHASTPVGDLRKSRVEYIDVEE